MNRFISLASLWMLLSLAGSADEAEATQALAFLSPSMSAAAFPILTDPAVAGLAAAPAVMSPHAAHATAGNLPLIPDALPIEPRVPDESLPAAILGCLGMLMLICRRRKEHA